LAYGTYFPLSPNTQKKEKICRICLLLEAILLSLNWQKRKNRIVAYQEQITKFFLFVFLRKVLPAYTKNRLNCKKTY